MVLGSYLYGYFAFSCHIPDDRGSDGSRGIALVGVVLEHHTTVELRLVVRLMLLSAGIIKSEYCNSYSCAHVHSHNTSLQ